jgi:hypothetical protein
MTRLARGVNRTATVLVGILLFVVGILAIVWRLDIVLDLPRSSNTDGVTDVLTSSWWPWASGVLGVVLMLIGLRWLLAHLPSNGVKELNLSGTGDEGRLRFNASSAAAAAAKQFAQLPSVRSSKGRVSRDRGQLVVALDATIDPAADLNELARAADQIVADLAKVMGRHDLYGRVRLRVSSSSRSRLLRVE